MALSRNRERLLARLRTRKGRTREGLVLVEGPRALAAALSAGAQVRFVVMEAGLHPTDSLSRLLSRASPEVVEVEAGAMDGFADTESPQGILAVVEEPVHPLPTAPWTADDPLPPRRILVLDALQDPGNAGTLIRTAVAFGVDAVVALDGTVDPWNPKTVRAAAGEAFRVPIHRMACEDFLEWHREARFTLVVADAGGQDVRHLPSLLQRIPPASLEGATRDVIEAIPANGHQPPWALVVGNEGAGPRSILRGAADRVLALPLAAGVESLNAAVAGAVLLWELGPARDQGPEPESLPPEIPTDPSPEQNRTPS